MLVNGIDLNVRVLGDGIPFIWGHGLMASMAMDDATRLFQMERPVEGERLVRYDARGHGGSQVSENPDDYLWPNLARDMLALADTLGIERFIAGGQSMGSATALYAALAAPERVKALVLVNPPTAWETRPAQAAIYERWAEAVEAKGLLGLFEQMQSQSPSPAWLWEWEAQSGVADELAKAYAALDARALPLIFRGAARTDLPPHEAIRAVKAPALILAWSDDPGHPLSSAETLQELLPDAHLEVAHNMDELAEWPRRIQEFVGRYA
jgi:3-oxoadipate enol-lactonase